MGDDLLPNYTFFIELALFFVSYFMLKTFVFGPYFQLLEMRRAKTTGLKEKSILDRERAEKLKTDYEVFMKAERKKLNGWMDEERKKISDEERATVQAAREKVGAEMKIIRQSLKDETERARKELSPLVSEFSSQIASKLMGRNVKVSSTATDHTAQSSAESTVPG